jgi:redox-sensitive bicupin YhaK (pirin superfamily)
MKRNIALYPPTQSSHFARVIGTTDFLGQGIVHPVADVNPFVLLDDAPTMRKQGMPPFGLHPHHGLHVASLLWEGRIESRLAHEAEPTLCGPGPVVVSIFAGRGMAHEEKTHSDEATTMEQLIWLIPEEARSRPAKATLSKGKFTRVGNGAEILVGVGKAFGIDSDVETHSPITVLMGRLLSGGHVSIPTIPGGTFFYALNGAVTANDQEVPEKTLAIVESGSDDLHLRNSGAGEVRFIFGNGARIEEPWVKLLTQNGFLLARDEAEAKRQEAISKKVGLSKYGSQE